MKTITKTKAIYNRFEADDVDLWLMDALNDGWEITIATPMLITVAKRVDEAEYSRYYNRKSADYNRYLNSTID